MMKRAKGATLDEIMAATGWQKHTVRGFVSILGSKGGQKVESSKNAAGETVLRHRRGRLARSTLARRDACPTSARAGFQLARLRVTACHSAKPVSL